MDNGSMSYNLFLDDVRMPVDVGNYFNPVEFRKYFRLNEWVIVRSYDEFINCIEKKGLPNLVSFDHDLEYKISESKCGENINDNNAWYYAIEDKDAKNGYDCAKYFWKKMVEAENYSICILCHSMNPVGKENILSVFQYQ